MWCISLYFPAFQRTKLSTTKASPDFLCSQRNTIPSTPHAPTHILPCIPCLNHHPPQRQTQWKSSSSSLYFHSPRPLPHARVRTCRNSCQLSLTSSHGGWRSSQFKLPTLLIVVTPFCLHSPLPTPPHVRPPASPDLMPKLAIPAAPTLRRCFVAWSQWEPPSRE